MKHAAAAVALFIAATAAAQQHTITVSGNGRATVTPDRVQFTIGVLTRSGSVADGVRDNNEKIRRVIDALKARGVPAAEIRTSNFSLQQPWENGRRVVGQYDVQNSVTVTRTDVANVSDLLQAAFDAGANQAGAVRFYTSDLGPARDQALAAAFADAKARATKLAAAAGRAVGDPITITTEREPTPPRVGGVEAIAAEGPPLESGVQVVAATVVVTFELK